MKEFCITYRNEFTITLQAKNKEEAIKKAIRGEGQIDSLGELWPDFMVVEEEGIDWIGGK